MLGNMVSDVSWGHQVFQVFQHQMSSIRLPSWGWWDPSLCLSSIWPLNTTPHPMPCRGFVAASICPLWTAARGFKEDLLPWTTTSALLQLNWPVFSLIYQALEDQSAAKDWSLRAWKVVDKGSSAALISMFIARPKRITEITLWRCPCQFDSGIWCQRPSGDCQAKAAVIVLDLNDLPRGMILVQRNLNQLVAYWLLCIVKFYPEHNQIAFLLLCSSDQMCNDIGVLQEAWHTWNSPLLLCWFDIGILEEKLYYSSRQNAEEYLWTNQCS